MKSTNLGKSNLQDTIKGQPVTKEKTGDGITALCIYNHGVR